MVNAPYSPPSQYPRAPDNWDAEGKRIWSELIRILENDARLRRDRDRSRLIEERVETYVADVTIDDEAIVLINTDTAAADVTVTLPEAELREHKVLYIKNIGTGAYSVIVTPRGTQTIDGAATQTVGSYSTIKIVSDGSNWWII